MQRQIEMIGAAWGLGGADPGCAQAPAHLAPLLEQRLRACGVPLQRGEILAETGNERRKDLAVSRLCGRLAAAVADSVRAGRLPCVLGGDHSCAAGTWCGVARVLHGPLGLIWVDAHMDAHTPGTSPSGRLHGMPLAWLLGQDDDPLYGLTSGVLDPRHVCLIGVRSFEPEEAQRLARLGVRVFFMEEVRRRGLATVFDEALAIATGGTQAFGITVDLDAVTPEEAPAVATPAAQGLNGRELAAVLARVAGNPSLAGVELVEYCPRLDQEQRSASLAVDILAATLCAPRENA